MKPTAAHYAVAWIVGIAVCFGLAVGMYQAKMPGPGTFFLVMAILLTVWRFYEVARHWDW